MGKPLEYVIEDLELEVRFLNELLEAEYQAKEDLEWENLLLAAKLEIACGWLDWYKRAYDT